MDRGSRKPKCFCNCSCVGAGAESWSDLLRAVADRSPLSRETTGRPSSPHAWSRTCRVDLPQTKWYRLCRARRWIVLNWVASRKRPKISETQSVKAPSCAETLPSVRRAFLQSLPQQRMNVQLWRHPRPKEGQSTNKPLRRTRKECALMSCRPPICAWATVTGHRRKYTAGPKARHNFRLSSVRGRRSRFAPKQWPGRVILQWPTQAILTSSVPGTVNWNPGAIPHRLAGADTDGGTLLTRGYARNAVQGSDSA